MSTLLKNSFHALYRAASSGAQLAHVYISKSADVMDCSKKIEYLTSTNYLLIWIQMDCRTDLNSYGPLVLRPLHALMATLDLEELFRSEGA